MSVLLQDLVPADLATVNGGDGASSTAAMLIQELWGGMHKQEGLNAILLYARPQANVLPVQDEITSIEQVLLACTVLAAGCCQWAENMMASDSMVRRKWIGDSANPHRI